VCVHAAGLKAAQCDVSVTTHTHTRFAFRVDLEERQPLGAAAK